MGRLEGLNGQAFREFQYPTPPLAIYAVDALEAHRAFIARRRDLRPAEDYTAVTAEEWQEFLSHFERRKLALGECGRAYGTDIHEHACVRCPVLIVALDEKPRLEEIRDNLKDRIAEAKREGWLGEVEGLSTSLAAAEDKIAQIEAQQEKKQSPVFLGLPSSPPAPAKPPSSNRRVTGRDSQFKEEHACVRPRTTRTTRRAGVRICRTASAADGGLAAQQWGMGAEPTSPCSRPLRGAGPPIEQLPRRRARGG
ncbi:hypothetical protein ACFVSQ_37140 [Streptomyces niveus]|uniref:hypothetical protein n=1 Tax=Streptomyces niveus TaxID=193462 RepID=UPI0036E4255E